MMFVTMISILLISIILVLVLVSVTRIVLKVLPKTVKSV